MHNRRQRCLGLVLALAWIASCEDRAPTQRVMPTPTRPQGSAGTSGIDCNRDGVVDVDDVRAGLQTAVGIRSPDHCGPLDANKDGKLSTEERLAAAPNDVMRRYWWQALEWNDPPSAEAGTLFGNAIHRMLAVDGFPGPGDVLMRNAVITAKYAGWYHKRPDELKWAGCAAFVSYKVGLGLIPFKPGTVVDRFPGAGSLETEPARLGTLDLLRLTNTAVYHDLAWAHEAYMDSGLPAVEQGLQGVPDHELMLEGFRAIDQGRALLSTSGPRAQELIWRGNTLLLRHEQSGIIQDRLSQIDQLSAQLLSWVVAIDFSGEIVPEKDSLVRFTRSMERQGRRDGSVAKFADRWLWIEDEILPTWRALDERKREMLIHRAERLMDRPNQNLALKK